MSVVASSNDEPETEELRRAQRAHEPSMEEILASIRAIIADDREPAPKSGPQIVYSSDAPVRSAEFEPEPAPAPTVVWNRKAELSEAKSGAEDGKPAEEASPEQEDAPLLSQDTESAVAASFQSLAESMAAHGREAAERLARDMLRPMLKDWLDANLPAMVERLVKAEIQRLARGGR